MSIKGKLFLGFGAVILVLLVLGYQSYSTSKGMQQFARQQMPTAMDAADGAMESRINYLHLIWGALEGSMAATAEKVEEGRQRFENADAGFQETIALLERSGLVQPATISRVKTLFANLRETGKQMFAMRARTMELMEELDAGVVQIVELLVAAEAPAATVHVVWSYAMAMNDYAAYGHAQALQEAREISQALGRLPLAGDDASMLSRILDVGDTLAARTQQDAELHTQFDDTAEELDELMERIEEGDGNTMGADAYVDSLLERLADLADSSLSRQMAYAGGGVLLALLLALLITRSIVTPVKRIQNFSAEVAQGRLDASISGAFSGELASMKESIQGMVTNLKAKMQEAEEKSEQAEEQARQAREATREAEEAKAQAEQARSQGMLQAAGRLDAMVERVSSAATQLSAQSEQISRGAQEQHERVSETATAMEEMSATVLEVARNSSSAADSSDENRKKALEGKDVVAKTIESIMEVQGNTAELSQVMNELSEKAESIGQVMGVINDIADQTNLLALNAAIEAARAGEAGRGFAVVADEVRKLAEKTMTATQEVGSAISGIQDSVRVTSQKRQQAEQALDRTIDLAQNAGNLLGEIVTTVEAAASMVSSIATAAEEQSATAEEINRSVEAISNIARDTASSLADSSSAIDDLAQQAQAMQGLIAELKSEAEG